MWLKGSALVLGSTVIVSALILFQILRSGSSQQSVDQNVVSRYVQAVQKRDFKTLIDLTYSYQEQVDSIKANNPQVLWPKQIANYYNVKISNLSQSPGFRQSYGEQVIGGANNPDQAIRALQVLLPAICKWKVTESRSNQVQDPMTGSRYERTSVYVTVDYPSASDSPTAGTKKLKETIIEFTVYAKSRLVMGASRLSQGDVYWPVPGLTSDEAIALIKAHASPELLHPYIIIRAQALLPYGPPPWIKEYKPFFERHGFMVHPFVFQQGAPIQVDPPADWEKFRLNASGTNGTSPATYQLDNSVRFEISDLQQQDTSAVAKLRLKVDGCNPVCAMIREYWGLGWSHAFPYRGDSFFWTHWVGANGQAENAGGSFPAYLERTAYFQWSPSAMDWQMARMAATGQGPLVSQ